MFRHSLKLVILLPMVVLWLLVPPSSVAQTTGSFSGLVLLDNQEPISGALVTFTRVRKLQADSLGRITPLEPPFGGSVSSAPDGTFRVDKIPVGDYYVCAAGAAANHLRSCDWGQQSMLVHVLASGNSARLTLNIRTGATVTVVIDDPHARIQLQDPKGITAGETSVALGVMSSSGQYSPARFIGKAGTQWIYTVAVPISVPLKLFLDTALDVLDQSGALVSPRQPTLPVSADQAGVTLRLSVQ
jgi:hypothetical protein